MIEWLKPLWQKLEYARPLLQGKPAIPSSSVAPSPVYPPIDQGLPAVSVEQIMSSQAELEDRIFRAIGLPQKDFDHLLQPVMRNLAMYVHLLPATAKDHHSGAGGLYHLCLDISLHALQGANTAVFPVGGEVERRYFLQPRWAMATWLAGLCCQIERVATDMVVINERNQKWQPLMGPLLPWLKSTSSSNYYVRWMGDSSINTAQAFLVKHVLTESIIEYLSHENQDILPSLMAYLSEGANVRDNPIAHIVTTMAAKIIERDRKRSATNYGKLTAGAHLEPYLIGAMRRLLDNEEWLINGRNAVIFIGKDGVYLDWMTATPQILRKLAEDGLKGMPSDADTLADILLAANVFDPPSSNKRYWEIHHSARGDILSAVKFTVDSLIFPDDIDISDLAAETLCKSKQPPVKVVAQPAPAPEAIKKPRNPAKASSVTKPAPSRPAAKPEPEPVEPEVPPECEQPPLPDQAPPDFSQGEDESSFGDLPPLDSMPADQPREGGEQENAADLKPDETAERTLAELKKEHAWLMREILTAAHTGKLTGKIIYLPYGVGISHDELTAHGQEVFGFINALASKQWLWIDNKKPNSHLHVISIEGKSATERAIVLRKDKAAALGLVQKRP